MICCGTGGIGLQVATGPFPLLLTTFSWTVAAVGVGICLLHLMNWAIVFSPPDRSGVASAAVQTCRLLGSAAGGALMGALLHGIGSDPAHITTGIAAVFALAAAFAIMPATLLRPKVSLNQEAGVAEGVEAVAARDRLSVGAQDQFA